MEKKVTITMEVEVNRDLLHALTLDLLSRRCGSSDKDDRADYQRLIDECEKGKVDANELAHFLMTLAGFQSASMYGHASDWSPAE
jgi:hypothetical protein